MCTWYLHTLHAAIGVLDLTAGHGVVPVGDPPSTMQRFPAPGAALAWLTEEFDNLAAVGNIAADVGLDAIAWRVLVLLRIPFVDRRPVAAWLDPGHRALEAARRDGDPLGQIIALVGLGISYRLAQRIEQAVRSHQEALTVPTGDPRVDALRRNTLGLALLRARRLQEARACFQTVRDTAQANGDEYWTVMALANLAETALAEGRYGQAREALSQAFAKIQPTHPGLDRADVLRHQATLERETGHIHQARASIEQGLALASERSAAIYEGILETELGLIQIAEHDPASALDTLAHACSIHRRLGDRSREALALDATGLAYQALGQPEQAVDFHRMAAAGHRDMHDEWNHALALTHLAVTLDALGEHDQARQTRTEALELSAAYDDPRATRLRQHLTEAAHDQGT